MPQTLRGQGLSCLVGRADSEGGMGREREEDALTATSPPRSSLRTSMAYRLGSTRLASVARIAMSTNVRTIGSDTTSHEPWSGCVWRRRAKGGGQRGSVRGKEEGREGDAREP